MSQLPKMEVEMNKLMCERVYVLADLRNNELTHSKVSTYHSYYTYKY